jgi:hypothetical protein
MIVLLPYANSFIVFPLENQAEKPPDFDSILALSVTREGMRIPTGLGHVSWTHSRIQHRKELLQVLSRPWGNALGAASPPEPAQGAIREAHANAVRV